MHPKHWNLIEKVNGYLNSKKEIGIKGMTDLLDKITSDKVDLVVLTFTYERLEIYIKQNNQFTLHHDLSDSLNRYEIEDMTDFDYDCENELESFQSDQIYTITSELIKSWLVECYQIARDNRTIEIKVYFKEQHDQMEIFELNSCQTFYEKTAFETFVKNNQSRQILLLQP